MHLARLLPSAMELPRNSPVGTGGLTEGSPFETGLPEAEYEPKSPVDRRNSIPTSQPVSITFPATIDCY